MNKNNIFDSLEDFKAAFVTVNEGFNGCLKSPKKLMNALHQCGRNPDKKAIEKYWNLNNYIDIDIFCKIASEEKKASEDDLLLAFKILDSNLDGFMTINELVDILGDELNEEEIKELFNDCKIRKNGKFCYEEFVDMIIETIKKSKRNTMKKMDMITKIEKERMLSNRSFSDDLNNNSIDRNKDSLEHIGYLKTNHYKKTDNLNKNLKQIKTNRNIGASYKKKVKEFELTSKSNSFNEYNLQYPKKLKKWFYKTTKGGFYFNENVNGIVANSFCLDLQHNSTLFFTIESFKTELHSIHNLDNMDVSLFIIRDDNKLSIECFTETKLDNKSCCKVDLTSGRYFLFPFTSGCHLKKHFNNDKLNKVQLLKQDLNGKTVLSSKFRDALNLVFDLIDLDSNGKLSQEEFNLYSFIRSNEDIPNKEWEFLGG